MTKQDATAWVVVILVLAAILAFLQGFAAVSRDTWPKE